MYNPGPFLISSAALTSIFSFFFGGYFREREWAYRAWIEYVAYNANLDCDDKLKYLCAKVETKDRSFRQAKALLGILLFTLLSEFIIFQIYSMKYIVSGSTYYETGALHTYLFFNSIIGIIVLINCFELLYIRLGFYTDNKFPFLRVRKRVTGQDRLSDLWQLFGCHKLKTKKFSVNKIPANFYAALERENK